MSTQIGVPCTVGELEQFCRDNAYWGMAWCTDAQLVVDNLVWTEVCLHAFDGTVSHLITTTADDDRCVLFGGTVRCRRGKGDDCRKDLGPVTDMFRVWLEAHARHHQISKLAIEIIIALEGVSGQYPDEDIPYARNKYESLRRIFLAAGLTGEDEKAVTEALAAASARVYPQETKVDGWPK